MHSIPTHFFDDIHTLAHAIYEIIYTLPFHFSPHLSICYLLMYSFKSSPPPPPFFCFFLPHLSRMNGQNQ